MDSNSTIDQDANLREASSSTNGEPSSSLPRRIKAVVTWACTSCQRECIPVRDESRCLCGHRLKVHSQGPAGNPDRPFKCSQCKCKSFFYIVAEGSWILRCRCKHKHIEHDPVTLKCAKPACAGKCAKFDSPWVCNCNHPWAEHVQKTELREYKSMAEMMAGVAPEVNNWAGVKRGKDAD
jgi:hypothetical protein